MHAHDHHHHAPQGPASAWPVSPLGAGLAVRLALAASAAGLLWLAVVWALN